MKRVTAKWMLAGLAALVAALALVCLLNGVPLLALDGPDVIVESFTLDPAIPDAGQLFTLTIVTRNQGNLGTGSSGFWNWMYLDPPVRPPTQTTPYDGRCATGPLAAGGSGSCFRTNFSFPITGCDHVVYAWADHDNMVAETIEANNLFTQTVCVGVTCQADASEPDNTCAAARWLTNTVGVAQHHTLCPVGDEDWVKFATVAGITYTIEAKNLGVHADPLLYLLSSCSGVAQYGDGPRIVWRSPSSGVAYVRVVHRQSTYGPLSDYDLTLTADNGGVYDIYEPDDTCASARDLPTDGTRQTHYFQVISDTDWVKFPIDSGQTAVLVADNTGSGVSPQVSVYNSCEQTFGAPIVEGPQPQFSTGGGGMFYAKVVNQNADVYGPTAFYDLSLNLTDCAADAWEADNTAAAAQLVSTNGVTRTHNICPAGDQDWVKFNAISGTTYSLETLNLGPAADTELFLYGPDGTTQLAYNDDYATGLLNSRIVWRAPMPGTFYAKIQHVRPNVAGPNTRYDFSISEGACTPDDYDSGKGDNGPLDANPLALDGTPQRRDFCPTGDQDWASFTASAGMTVTVQTLALVPGADTVLDLFRPDATTIITSNDDFGTGVHSLVTFIVPEAGTYYARVIPFNTNQFGDNTDYQLSATGSAPPPPTPTPTPSPTPAPTPPPLTTTANIRTLILVNRERMEALYSASAASQLMNKLYELADHSRVKGLVIQVESSPSVAAAYSQWTADEASLLNTDKANDVASAVRNLVLTYLESGPDIKHIVIVGDDRVIPFRRIEDHTNHQTVKETVYATHVTSNTTQWAALSDNMTLTDNYYADKVPTTRPDWTKGEIYLPDYGIGRLIETPDEIVAFINAFLASNGIVANRGLVTGYDFVEDTASVIDSLLDADSIPKDSSLVGSPWTATDLSSKQLASSPRVDVQSINGHANHEAEIAPDNSQLTAAEIATSTTDLSGAIIFTVGCHSGFNDSGTLSLAQAFAQKKANYVANTGYGWGGGGSTYSEALMRNYAVELLSGSSTEMGDALRQAKLLYYDQLATFNGYDDKILAEATFYGLPMTVITTGATFGGEVGFPSVTTTPTLPTGSLGQLNTGHMSCGLAGSFGAFDEVTNTQSFFGEGAFYALDDTIHASAGEPVQPKFFADLSAPSAGNLRGALFLGGVYSDVAHFNPVIVQPFNEYVTSTTEPAFASPGWYPPVPVSLHSQATISGSKGMLVTLLGQFDSSTGSERLYDHMAFDTYYSSDPDIQPPSITYVDGVLNETTGRGLIKVEANDPSGIVRVLAAFSDGNGLWQSQDLAYDTATLKWKGEITATLQTRYLIQAVDGAGNVGTAHNKGRYYSLLPPAPLIQGGVPNKIYLPIILKIGG